MENVSREKLRKEAQVDLIEGKKVPGTNGTVGALVMRSETFGIVWDDALQSSYGSSSRLRLACRIEA